MGPASQRGLVILGKKVGVWAESILFKSRQSSDVSPVEFTGHIFSLQDSFTQNLPNFMPLKKSDCQSTLERVPDISH